MDKPGDFTELAAEAREGGREAQERIGSPFGQGPVHHRLGVTAEELGRTDEALHHFRKNLRFRIEA